MYRIILSITSVFFLVHHLFAQVGIGTTTPSGMLHIVPTAANALVIDPYGTNAGETGEVQFKELAANGSNHVGLKAPDNIATDVVFVLPAADGTSGQALVTDASGNLSWASSSSGWWEEIGSTELTTAGDDLDVLSFTPKKYLWIQIFMDSDGGLIDPEMTFNNDGGSNYARRFNSNGTGENVNPSLTKLVIGNNDADIKFYNLFIINTTSEEKLGIMEVNQQVTAGAGNAPNRMEYVFKWANTSAQINRIDINNVAAGSFAAGSSIKVYGHD